MEWCLFVTYLSNDSCIIAEITTISKLTNDYQQENLQNPDW